MLSLYAWALALMFQLEPASPFVDTFPDLAFAIVDEATEHPIFAGPHAVERTIALDLAVAWYESRFQIDAKGDKGQSLGPYQINRCHAPADELTTASAATRHAQRLFAQSFRICGARPAPEALGWYASGGNGCGNARGRRQSAHRWALAARLAATAPRAPAPPP